MLIVAETISAQSGIGYMTMNAREFVQTDVVVVGILLYALLGKLADVFARVLERQLLPWHPAYAGALRPRTTRGLEARWLQAVKRPLRLRGAKA
jgi:sulfonate transport system permease protein